MFRAPATTNGAICLSSRSRPPQHFANHLPRSFLRPSSLIVLSLFLLPLLPSLRRPFFSATSSSSWSVGRSTFRPLCRLHHHRVSLRFQPSSFFLLFFSRFHLALPSTADRLLLVVLFPLRRSPPLSATLRPIDPVDKKCANYRKCYEYFATLFCEIKETNKVKLEQCFCDRETCCVTKQKNYTLVFMHKEMIRVAERYFFLHRKTKLVNCKSLRRGGGKGDQDRVLSTRQLRLENYSCKRSHITWHVNGIYSV